MTGNIIPAEFYYKAQKLRVMIRQQILDVLEEVDVLAQPCSTAAAAVMDPNAHMESKEQAAKALVEANLRSMFSLAGTPALSILCGFTSDGPGGLPLALQTCRQALRRGDGAAHGPRLRAEHRVASAAASDLASKPTK